MLSFAFTFAPSEIDAKADIVKTCLVDIIDFSIGWGVQKDASNNDIGLIVIGGSAAHLRHSATMMSATTQDMADLESYLVNLGF